MLAKVSRHTGSVSCLKNVKISTAFFQLMSMAVERALSDNISFRQGLPLGCLNYMGTHTSHVSQIDKSTPL